MNAPFPGALASREYRRRNAERIRTRRRVRYRALRLVGCTAEEAQRLRHYDAVEYARRKIAKGLRP